MMLPKSMGWVVIALVLQAGRALACPGDCDGDGAVTVDELVAAVASRRDAACPGLDVDGGGVSPAEIVAAIGNALAGCPFVGSFHAVADLGGGQTGVVAIQVAADGVATGTLEIGGAGGGSAAALPTSVSLTGTVNLASGAFTLSGAFDVGHGLVPVSIAGTLPLPLGGVGSATFHIGDDAFAGTVLAGPLPPAATPTPTPTVRGEVHVIEVGGAGGTVFFPEFLEIAVGDTVEWRWAGGPHSVVASAEDSLGQPTCDPSGAFASDVLSSGTFRYTFEVAGDFDYHCGVSGHCAAFESAVIRVIGPAATATPTGTQTPAPPTPTATPATIDGVSVDMIGTFAGTATAQSTGFTFEARIRIDAGSGSVTATDLAGTVFFFLGGSIPMTVLDPTHLSHHQGGLQEVTLTLALVSPGRIEGAFTVISPGMPSSPVLLDLARQP